MAGAVFAVVVSGLSDHQDQVSVLVLAEPIGRAETLTQSHLGVVGVSSSASIGLMAEDSAHLLVGKKSLLDLPARVPLLSSYFESEDLIPPGHILAGMRLAAGAYPAPSVVAGDLVDVVAVGEGSEPAQIVVKAVQIHAVVVLGTDAGPDLFVSVVVPEVAELEIASVGSRVKLFLLSKAAPKEEPAEEEVKL